MSGRLLISWSVSGELPWSGWGYLVATGFGLIAAAIIVASIQARVTVRRRLAWADAFQRPTGEHLDDLSTGERRLP